MLGIVSDNEFEVELGKIDNRKSNVPEIVELNHGRGIENNKVPSSLQKIISEAVISGEASISEAHEVTGVSRSSISAYKNDAASTSSYHTPKASLRRHNNEIKERIRKKANGVLNNSLNGLLEDGALALTSATEKAAIAKTMSGIILDMEPKGDTIFNDNRKVVVFAPRLKEEDDYDVLDVSNE